MLAGDLDSDARARTRGELLERAASDREKVRAR